MPWHHVWHHADYIQAVVGVIGGAATVGAVLYAYKLGRKASVDAARRALVDRLFTLADEYLERQRDLDEHGMVAVPGPTRRDHSQAARRATVASRVGQVAQRVGCLAEDVEQLFGSAYADRYQSEWRAILTSPTDPDAESRRMSDGIAMLARLAAGWAAGASADFKLVRIDLKPSKSVTAPPQPPGAPDKH